MILRSILLSQCEWLEHGFGTRLAPLSQDGMATLKQVHSATVLEAAEPGLIGEGDALVTKKTGMPVSVRTADCYPILLADARTHVVAAVHAGWRGTHARIVCETLQQMGSHAADVYAAIGPGIGACCYEVGEEVAGLFGHEGRAKIDLAAANRYLLLSVGVPASRIETLGGCTQCDASLFHSFRRDREKAGRMISFIAAR